MLRVGLKRALARQTYRNDLITLLLGCASRSNSKIIILTIIIINVLLASSNGPDVGGFVGWKWPTGQEFVIPDSDKNVTKSKCNKKYEDFSFSNLPPPSGRVLNILPTHYWVEEQKINKLFTVNKLLSFQTNEIKRMTHKCAAAQWLRLTGSENTLCDIFF